MTIVNEPTRSDETSEAPSGGYRTPAEGESPASSKAPPEPIHQFFSYEHLPEEMQEVSRPCGELAQQMLDMLPRNAERTAGLRKLLEAKDCFVRAAIAKPEAQRWVP